MTSRTAILEAAAELLAASPTGEISTRGVCDAAGVTQPVLYRLFGDKDGLLAAVVDHVWNGYLTVKRQAVPSADPVDDLRRGWAAHQEFALANPHAYRLLFGTTLTTTPESGAEAMRLLRAILERIAAEGRLLVTPEVAARIVMAANSGVALALLLRPTDYPDAQASIDTRDAVFGSIIAPADHPETGSALPVAAPFVAATTLRSALPAQIDDGVFSAAEAALLDDWLYRVQKRNASPRSTKEHSHD